MGEVWYSEMAWKCYDNKDNFVKAVYEKKKILNGIRADNRKLINYMNLYWRKNWQVRTNLRKFARTRKIEDFCHG